MNYHILLITPGFPKDEKETNSVTYLINFIKQFKTDYPAVKFTVLTLHYPFEAKRFVWHGMTVRSFGGYHIPKLLKPTVWYKCWKEACQIHKENPFTHIQTLWLNDTTLIGCSLAKKLKVGLISTAMGTEFGNRSKYLSRLDFSIINLVSVSGFQDKLMSNFDGALKSKIIPWGIPQSHLEYIPVERNIDLIFVGYLNKIKNVPLFIEIIEALFQQFPALKVSIVGDFFGGSKWREIVNQKGLNECITFHGIQTNEETLKIMRQSKIMVHTSSFESLGYAMLEAIASGTYVVSKQVGIAAPSFNWKIAKTKDEFIHQIASILKNYTNPEPKNLYPIKETVEKYKALYDSVARNSV